jgi:hypothetical protein
MTVEKFDKIYEEAIRARKEKYEALRERVMKAAASANNGRLPTIGTDGSLHAPCDGYEYYCGYKGGVYAAGQYLPFNPDSDSPNVVRTIRVLVEKSLVSDFEIRKHWIVGHFTYGHAGRSFRQDGRELCYLYLTAGSWLKKFFEKTLAEFEDRPIEKKAEAKPKGKAPVGKTTVIGIIKGLKEAPNPFAYRGTISKMFVELDNGSTCYGTYPSLNRTMEKYEQLICANGGSRGLRIKFSADFSLSDDETHAFFKSPKLISLESVEPIEVKKPESNMTEPADVSLAKFFKLLDD